MPQNVTGGRVAAEKISLGVERFCHQPPDTLYAHDVLS